MVDCRTHFKFDSYLIDSIIIYAKVSFNNQPSPLSLTISE